MSSLQSEESSLFVSPHAVVTRTLIKIDNISYAVAHVNSVYIARRTTHKAWIGLVICLALAGFSVRPSYDVWLSGVNVPAESSQNSLGMCALFLVLALGCLFYILFPMKALMIQMSSGKMQTLENRYAKALFPVKRAIEQAIDLRG